MNSFAVGLGAYVIARTADQGLADFLGLTTRRHGTDPLSWVKIHLRGATGEDDQSGFSQMVASDQLRRSFCVATHGDEYGVDWYGLLSKAFSTTIQEAEPYLPVVIRRIYANVAAFYFANRITRFIHEYVVKQITETSPILGYLTGLSPVVSVVRSVSMRAIPLGQKIAANYMRCHQNLALSSGLTHVAAVFASVAVACVTPSIKLRFNEKEPKNQSTELVPGNFIRGYRSVSITQMGLLGTVCNGTRLCVPPLPTSPLKVLGGGVWLGGAAALTFSAYRICPDLLRKHRTALIAGAVLALV